MPTLAGYEGKKLLATSFEQKLICTGKVKAALRLITEHGDQDCLPLFAP